MAVVIARPTSGEDRSLTRNVPLEGGGVPVGKEVVIEHEVQVVKR